MLRVARSVRHESESLAGYSRDVIGLDNGHDAHRSTQRNALLPLL
jgi:hypothetical protein